MVDIKTLLKITMDSQSSDLHLTVDSPPVLRIDAVTSELTIWKEVSKATNPTTAKTKRPTNAIGYRNTITK